MHIMGVRGHVQKLDMLGHSIHLFFKIYLPVVYYTCISNAQNLNRVHYMCIFQ